MHPVLYVVVFVIGTLIFLFILIPLWRRENNIKKIMISKDPHKNINLNDEDKRFFFQHFLNEIKSLKSYQWNLTNYCLLIYGVIIGLDKLFNCEIIRYILILITILIFCSTFYYILQAQLKMVQSRVALRKYDEKLYKSAHYWIDDIKKQEEVDQNFLRDLIVIFPFMAIIIGFIFVLIYFLTFST